MSRPHLAHVRSLAANVAGRVPVEDVLALEPHGEGYALLAFWAGGLSWIYTTRLDQLAEALFPEVEP